ncbi:MAG: CRISPR-associated endoribonuclease Cas6 [Thaumarchaeota archaeon]|nr:CRISPR-associated endoribonuclease Cas6 [Nitrososphaerota archaeon]
MRILLKLRSLETQKYDMGYHHKLQSFIYKMLMTQGLTQIHDKKGYKFFCFSNIFPSNNMHRGDLKSLIISSPNEKIIRAFERQAQQIRSDQSSIMIGNMTFILDRFEVFSLNLPDDNVRMITGTPIIIRIPRERYLKYGINPEIPYNYIFWRKEHPIEMFIEQIEENLKKKYEEFTTKPVVEETILSKIKFRKQISNKIPLKGDIQTIIGTLWEFDFHKKENMDLLQFSLDAGFGERNSLGFGFMNLQ